VSSTWLWPFDLLARLGSLLRDVEGARDRSVVRLDNRAIPTYERLERHALGRREGKVDADAVLRIMPRR
jgi:hypothetical protein